MGVDGARRWCTGIVHRHLLPSLFGDVVMKDYELWAKERRESRLNEQFGLTLVFMGIPMTLVLMVLSDLAAKKFGLTLGLVWLLPSAVVSFYAIRKLVYLGTEEDE